MRLAAFLVTAVLLVLAGGALRSDVPVMAGISLVALALLCLATVLVAWLGLARRHRWLAALLPQPHIEGGAWERLDARGELVERIVCEEVPRRRGLWRRQAGKITWRDWLGLWSASREAPIGADVCVPPARAASGTTRDVVAAGSPAGMQGAPEGGEVRRYERGDPLRLVAWRQSAHHGRLMSYDTHAAEGDATIVAVDALSVPYAPRSAADEGDTEAANAAEASDRADALASCAWELALDTRGQGRTLVTDGLRACEQARDVARLLASFETSAGAATASERASFVQGVSQRVGGSGASRILLVTCERGGMLEHELRRDGLSGSLEVIVAQGTGTSGEPSSRRDKEQPAGAVGRLRQLAGRLPAMLCCLLLLALALLALADLANPGPWLAGCATLYAVLAPAATLTPDTHPIRKAVIGGVLAIAGGIALATLVHLVALGTLPGVHGSVTSSVWDLPTYMEDFIQVAQLGMADLYRQWVPLEVSVQANVLLALLGAAVGLPLWLALSNRHTRPLTALLPLAALSARDAFLGTPATIAELAVLAAATAYLLAVSGGDEVAHAVPLPSFATAPAEPPAPTPDASPSPWRHLPLPVCSCALALACALALSPALEDAVSGLGLGLRHGVLGTNGLDPVLDLSQDLVRGGGDAHVVYTTSSDTPVYLRLTTLTSFDGNSWTSDDAGTSAPAQTGKFSDGTPLEDAGSPLVQGVATSLSAEVEIRTLASAFAPSLANATSFQPASDGVAVDGWEWLSTGSLVPPRGTRAGMTYRVSGPYVDPVTNGPQAQALAKLKGALGDLDSYADLDDDALAPYLELPQALPDSVTSLADELRDVASSHDDTVADGDVATLVAMLDFFASDGFTYALSAPEGSSNLEVIDEFLTTRRGYCAHYATTFAVLARRLGLPCRVALGYRAGTSRDAEGRFIMTPDDLHAWDEVYLEGVGWVPVDVTPATSITSTSRASGDSDYPTAATASGVTRTPSPTTRAGEARTRGVAEPEGDEAESPADTEDAQSEGTAVTTDHPSASAALRGLGAALAKVVPLLLVAAILALPAVVRLVRRRRRLNALARGHLPHTQAWRELLDTALDYGIAVSPDMTEQQVCEAIIRETELGERLAHGMRTLARRRCEEAYGSGTVPCPPEELSALRAMVLGAGRSLAPRRRMRLLACLVIPRSVLPKRWRDRARRP